MSKKKNKLRITPETIYKPKKFTLRNYNRFISQFIQKDNYGWYNNGQRQKFRYKAEQIRLWRKSKNRFNWTQAFLKETDRIGEYDEIYERINDSFESHLYKVDGYIYYTSSINTDVAMFCLDIDSHEEQDLQASISASHYIIDTFFPGAYFDVSTHGAGIHLYVFIDFSGFPHFSPYDLEIRNRQFSTYLDNLRPIIKHQFNIDLDKPKGTYPHDYNLSNRGTLCKLPLPKTQEKFSHLVNSPIFTFDDLCSTDETVKHLLTDIMATQQPQETENTSEAIPQTPTYTGGPYTNNILGQETSLLNQKERLKMSSPDATERARASMRTLFRELGRRPSYEEWNADAALCRRQSRAKHLQGDHRLQHECLYRKRAGRQ